MSSSSCEVRPRFPSSSVFIFTGTSGAGQEGIDIPRVVEMDGVLERLEIACYAHRARSRDVPWEETLNFAVPSPDRHGHAQAEIAGRPGLSIPLSRIFRHSEIVVGEVR